MITTYLVAVGLHTVWDSIGDVTGYAVLGAISLALLTGTTHRLGGHRREHPARPATIPA